MLNKLLRNYLKHPSMLYTQSDVVHKKLLADPAYLFETKRTDYIPFYFFFEMEKVDPFVKYLC